MSYNSILKLPLLNRINGWIYIFYLFLTRYYIRWTSFFKASFVIRLVLFNRILCDLHLYLQIKFSCSFVSLYQFNYFVILISCFLSLFINHQCFFYKHFFNFIYLLCIIFHPLFNYLYYINNLLFSFIFILLRLIFFLYQQYFAVY